MKKIIALSLLVCVGCKKPAEESSNFDKSELLTNMADEIILNSVSDFESRLNDLKLSYEVFKNDQTVEHFDAVKEDWKMAYTSWQGVKIFDFGPILDHNFKLSAGTFPSDTAQINANLSNGSYDLSAEESHDAIGLSSLDYLFYRPNALNDFSNESYKNYVTEIIQKLIDDLEVVKAEWQNYRSDFVNSTGTESTSSLSILVNNFNKDYEIAKNAKLGIPLGKQSLGIQLPDYIEARSSGFSFELLRSSIVNLQGVFNGDYHSASGNGIGFYEYLVSLEETTLAADINSRFNTIINKIDAFNSTLEEAMVNDLNELDELYYQISAQVVNIKTDMTSAFGVLITYQDNDGD